MSSELPVEFDRVMLVVAHPDDSEFMAAGTIAKWAREGRHIIHVICTNGDKGSSDPEMTPDRLAKIRLREQREACNRVGGRELVIMGYHDGMLVNSLGLRRDIVRQIRRYRPHVVVCQDPTAHMMPNGFINHPDHRAAGAATFDAIYPSARDRLVFPELMSEGLEPHIVREVFVGGAMEANTWVDITETIDVKVHALRAHESQTGPAARPGQDLEARLRERAARVAEGRGMRYAEAFRRITPH